MESYGTQTHCIVLQLSHYLECRHISDEVLIKFVSDNPAIIKAEI
jgi:hypothetical protein